LKILNINPAAEKYFGKKLEVVHNKNFIKMFIPVALWKKTEDEMNIILSESLDTRSKIQVITQGHKIADPEWSVTVLMDDQKMPVGMILSTKK
jgi:hypothetical protein